MDDMMSTTVVVDMDGQQETFRYKDARDFAFGDNDNRPEPWPSAMVKEFKSEDERVSGAVAKAMKDGLDFECLQYLVHDTLTGKHPKRWRVLCREHGEEFYVVEEAPTQKEAFSLGDEDASIYGGCAIKVIGPVAV